MKKVILIVLLCSLFIALFSGCSLLDNSEDETQQNGAQNKAPEELSSKDNELVVALMKYLQELFIIHDMPNTSMAIKIDEIKNEKRALHVEFNPSRYYFVCAYHNGTHENETTDYCCTDEYIWVKFESECAISEEYKNAQFIVAFQVNEAAFVRDIISNSAHSPDIEHFQMYKPEFNNGINTNDPLIFDRTFIYLHSTDKSKVYHSTMAYNNVLLTLPCICLDEEYYITTELYTIYPDGSRSEANPITDFGKYYDDLVGIMDPEKYSVTDEIGRTTFFGLIRIDSFVDCIDG